MELCVAALQPTALPVQQCSQYSNGYFPEFCCLCLPAHVGAGVHA